MSKLQKKTFKDLRNSTKLTFSCWPFIIQTLHYSARVLKCWSLWAFFALSCCPCSFALWILLLCLTSLWLAISVSPWTALANHYAFEQTELLVICQCQRGRWCTGGRGDLVLGKKDLLTWSPFSSSRMPSACGLLTLSHGGKLQHGEIKRHNPQGNSLRFTAFTLGVWANELASRAASVFMNT